MTRQISFSCTPNFPPLYRPSRLAIRSIWARLSHRDSAWPASSISAVISRRTRSDSIQSSGNTTQYCALYKAAIVDLARFLLWLRGQEVVPVFRTDGVLFKLTQWNSTDNRSTLALHSLLACKTNRTRSQRRCSGRVRTQCRRRYSLTLKTTPQSQLPPPLYVAA
jgi:hypothetical protein